ncbi:MAG TPA: hypothetical protein VF306_01485, partial [Pirellulales bacterium]
RIRVRWRPAQNRDGMAQPPGPADVTPYVKWLSCHSCKGEIGVPESRLALSVACPKCGAIVPIQNNFRVLWKPPAPPEAALSQGGSTSLTVEHLAALLPAASDVTEEQPVTWRGHIFSLAALFTAVAVIGATLRYMSLNQASMIANLAVVAVGSIIGIGCGLIVVVEMIDRDRRSLFLFLLIAVVYAFAGFSSIPERLSAIYVFVMPTAYILAFFAYSWLKATEFGIRRTMLVWTYCLAAALAVFASAGTISATSPSPNIPVS